MIQCRLLTHVDPHLVEFQYGFRPGRSTATPIFIARRVQDLAERSGQRLMMLALDYSKAFDFLPHSSISTALTRHRVDPVLAHLIMAIYADPRFAVSWADSLSADMGQCNGIRQGCPLSPLLFIMVTSMMWRDLLVDLRQRPFVNPWGLTSPISLYADDTLLMATRPPDLRRLLHLTECHSATHNLQLNAEKCELLVTNDDGVSLRTSEGRPIRKVCTLKYLGATFHNRLDIKHILQVRLTEARHINRQLERFWAHRRATIPWKVTVFNAVIRSRVFYTLETLELTEGCLSMIDALYYRGLRRILRIPTTFVARNWSNARILARAQALAVRPQRQGHPQIVPFSRFYRQQRTRLLGHLLRSPVDDPARLAILTRDHGDLTDIIWKRVGRPRHTWLRSALQDARAALPPDTQAEHTPFTIPDAIDLAHRRIPPFAPA